MVKASKKAGLGNTLIKAQKFAHQRRNPRKSKRHTTETNPGQDNAKLNLRSVTAQTNLDEFFEEAELAGKQFVTERRNLTMIDQTKAPIDLYADYEKQAPIVPSNEDISNCLSIPRRPKWDSSTTPEQLDEMERFSFLDWRRRLARVQESDGVYMTPFEKNLEVWRQLWRVIERSDIIVQILDCRNPLLYLCQDLIRYVEEHGNKLNLILLNKADFLTVEQRKLWLQYFQSINIKAIFFSALFENENIKTSSQEDHQENTRPMNDKLNDIDSDQSNSQDEDETTSEDVDDDDELANQIEEKLNVKEDTKSPSKPHEDETRIYNKYELLDAWRDILMELRVNKDESTNGKDEVSTDTEREESCSGNIEPDILTIGLVGYPNVGKSSTINALLSAKRVAVSATPGKTKHFQTFMVERDMMLCDCPGLVFPNFVSNKSEMVINGVLPIDQMKDYVSPVRIIVSRIPKAFFEDLYGLAFDQNEKQNLIAEDLLNSFGFMRGYMTARGLPDISRAARKVCKDYINGKILYCEPPPNVDKLVYQSHSKLAEAIKRILARAKNSEQALKMTDRQRRLMAQAKGTDITDKEFDAQFFQEKSNGIHIKGLPGIGNMVRPIGECQATRKASRREKKHKKREKLRIVYRHLDI